MRRSWLGGLLSLVALLACETPIEPLRPDGAGADVDAGPSFLYGCRVHREPLGAPGDPAMGDTYADFAAPLFERICVRCHATTLTTPEDRNNAPDGFDWDDEASVRAHLPEIRRAVGVENFMDPDLIMTCEERRRMVRWIDIGAP